MDFSSMMNAASKNAKKASREVDRILETVDQEKNEVRRQLEAEKRARLEMQRRKQEKEKEIARKRKEREEEERRKNFTIPKKNDGPSSSSSINTDAVRAVLERQRAEKEAKERKAESDKKKLMMLRMQANGGKATKKMGKQFGLDVIDLQTRFGGNNEHLEILQKRKWKEEEEADMEADKYRSGVYKALATKQKTEGSLRSTVQGPHRVATSKSNSLAGLCSRHERTRDTFSPPKDGKKVSERREPIIEKKKIQAAAPIDFKSLMAAASSISQGKSVNLDHLQAKPAKCTLAQQQKLPSSSSSIHQKTALYSSEKPGEKERLKEKMEAEKRKLKEKERERQKARVTAASSSSHKHSSSNSSSSIQKSETSSSNGHGVPAKKESRKPFQKGPTPPPMIPAAIPGKKYLPGDVRYKEQQALMKATAIAPGVSRNGTAGSEKNNKERILAVREAERQREKEREKQKSLKRARGEEMLKEYEREKKIQRKSEKAGPPSSYYSSSLPSKNYDSKNSYEARRMAELREQQLREKERKKKMQRERERDSRGGGSFCKNGRNYSDEEMDEDEYDDDDNYSDMDDFIDDTEMDMSEMNRKDFEDTLRMVNRKYDTDKWSRREKMISERDMHSNFRRIQSEENFSKRAGFMEDLREASNGRSVQL